jgi:hypothetical protein
MSLSHLMQIDALRQALERATRAAELSKQHDLLMIKSLHMEQARAKGLEEELRVVKAESAELFAENRRLRNLMGEVAHDKNSATSELRALLQEVRDLTPAKPTQVRERRDVA